MKHDGEQAMVFAFLGGIDFTRPWEEIDHDMGYRFGDWAFCTEGIQERIRRLARQMHIELNDIDFNVTVDYDKIYFVRGYYYRGDEQFSLFEPFDTYDELLFPIANAQPLHGWQVAGRLRLVEGMKDHLHGMEVFNKKEAANGSS